MQDYFVHPVLRPSGLTACVQIYSRQICRIASQVLELKITVLHMDIFEK